MRPIRRRPARARRRLMDGCIDPHGHAVSFADVTTSVTSPRLHANHRIRITCSITAHQCHPTWTNYFLPQPLQPPQPPPEPPEPSGGKSRRSSSGIGLGIQEGVPVDPNGAPPGVPASVSVLEPAKLWPSQAHAARASEYALAISG